MVLTATGFAANSLVAVAKESVNGLMVLAIGMVDAGTIKWASSSYVPVDSLDVLASAFKDV